jgi:hypothetical protein
VPGYWTACSNRLHPHSVDGVTEDQQQERFGWGFRHPVRLPEPVTTNDVQPLQDDDVDDDGISRSELEVERKKWILRFFEVVQQDTYARDALDFLVTGGMAREHVASVLFWYTHPVSAYYQSRISTLAKQHVPMLKAIQKELWDGHLALVQDDADRMTAPSSWPVAQIDDVAEAMMEVSVLAADLAHILRPYSSAKGKLRNEEVIVSFCLEVRAITGKPHWADIAYLLEAAWKTRQKRQMWDQDRLRKVFNRYRGSYPTQFNALEERAESMKDKARPQPNGRLARSTRNRRQAQPKSNAVVTYKWREPRGVPKPRY